MSGTSKTRWRGEMNNIAQLRWLEGKRLARFGRESTELESEMTGPEVQDEEYLKDVKELGAKACETGYFDVQSGTSSDRPGLQQGLADGERGMFDVAWWYDVSRFMREEGDAHKTIEKFHQLGIPCFFSKNGNLLTWHGENWQEPFNAAIAAAANQSRMTGIKVGEGLALKRTKYKLPAGMPPEGFTWGDAIDPNAVNKKKGKPYRTWVWNDVVFDVEHQRKHSDAPVLLFQWWIEGDHSFRSLARRLTELGYTIAGKRPWTLQAVTNALRNTAVLGLARQNIGPWKVDAMGRRSRPADGPFATIDVPGLEARVSRAVFDQVQTDLATPNVNAMKRFHGARGEIVSIFQQVARCADCGGGFTRFGSGPDDRLIICIKHIPAKGSSCRAWVMSEQRIGREYYLWLCDLVRRQEADEWVAEYIKAYTSDTGSADWARTRADIEEKLRRNQKGYDDLEKSEEDYLRRRTQLRAQLANAPKPLPLPRAAEYEKLAKTRLLFGDPAVSRTRKAAEVTALWEKLVIQPDRGDLAGKHGPRPKDAPPVIVWNASVVRDLYKPLVHAYQTSENEEGSYSCSAPDSSTSGYEEFLKVLLQPVAA